MSVFRRKGAASFTIEFRDARLPGGAISLSARTSKRAEAEQRERAIRTALDWKTPELKERLLSGRAKGGLHITDVLDAVKKGDAELLMPGADQVPMLAASVDRTLKVVRDSRRIRTVESYEFTLRDLEEHFGVLRGGDRVLRDVPLSELTEERLHDWLYKARARCGGKPWSNNTRVNRKGFVQAMLSAAVKREVRSAKAVGRKPHLDEVTIREVDVGGQVRTRFAWLRFEQIDQLLEATRGTPICAWVALGFFGGLRCSERRYLRTGVDLELAREVDGKPAPRIRVQERDGAFAWVPKSMPQGERDVPANATLLPILEEHARLGFTGERFFFRTWNGKGDRPIGRDTGGDWSMRALRAAGLPYGRKDPDSFTDHSLRHTFGSLLAHMNVHPKRAAKLMGITVKVYMDTYLHLVPEDDEAVMAMLDTGLAAARSAGAKPVAP